MIVTCASCGRKYKIDPDKIKGERARFHCKGCASVVTVDKSLLTAPPAEPESDEDLFAAAPVVRERAATPPAPTTPAATAPPPPSSTSPAHPPGEEGKRRSGLTAKVILLMLLVGIVPGGIYFALSFHQTSERIRTDTEAYGLQISDILAGEVDEWIDKNIRVLGAVADLPAMQSMHPDEQETVLKAVQSAYPWMYLVFTTDERGINIARSDDKPLKDYSSRQYVKDVMAGNDMAWQNLIGKTSKKPALVLAVPIQREDGTVGVLASAMTREAISKLVTNWEHGETGSVFLVDEAGKVLAHQEEAYVTEQRDFSANPLVLAARESDRRRAEFVGPDGDEWIGFTQNTQLGWTMAIQQKKREAFQALTQAQHFAYALLGGTVLVILVVSLLSSRAIVAPIKRLTEAANRISVGELDVEIASNSPDEIGDLADAIGRMQDSIRLSIARLQRRRA